MYMCLIMVLNPYKFCRNESQVLGEGHYFFLRPLIKVWWLNPIELHWEILLLYSSFMPALPCHSLYLASLQMWEYLLKEPRKFSRIPHSFPESNPYPFNHEGFWNEEPVALGYCSHIPKNISWAVKNQSEPNESCFLRMFWLSKLCWRPFLARSEIFPAGIQILIFLPGHTEIPHFCWM